MFTVEFEMQDAVITSMDTTGDFSDIEVIIGDNDQVYMRQFDEDLETYEMVIMTYKQFLQIFAAMKSTEGVYRLENRSESI